MSNIKNVNIYGSTGQIGSKSLSILKKFFPFIKINLLLANKNYKKLIEQTNMFNPKFVCINDRSKISYLRKNIKNKNIEIIDSEDLSKFIKSLKSDMSILAISGYQSLNFLASIFVSSKILISCHGAVSHAANSFNVKNIDIIEESKVKFYQRFTSYLKNYSSIYRSQFSFLQTELLNKIKT